MTMDSRLPNAANRICNELMWLNHLCNVTKFCIHGDCRDISASVSFKKNPSVVGVLASGSFSDVLSIVFDSPVSVDSSTFNWWVSIKRTSAGFCFRLRAKLHHRELAHLLLWLAKYPCFVRNYIFKFHRFSARYSCTKPNGVDNNYDKNNNGICYSEKSGHNSHNNQNENHKIRQLMKDHQKTVFFFLYLILFYRTGIAVD
jgi:hypothetical protein